MRRLLAAVLAAGLIAISLPIHREVVGLSMAPDLMPGDRVVGGALPWRDLWRIPAVHERWIVSTPDGTEAIKRVTACGPATLRIVDGDLELDGRIEPPPPEIFVEQATVVREIAVGAGGEELHVVSAGEAILDDAAFAPNERRVLLPVADVGVCVVVRVDRDAVASPAAEVVIGFGDRLVRWRPSGAGTFAFLAGRIDRHRVGVAWRLRGNAVEGGPDHGGRPLRLPSDPPPAWSVKDIWTGDIWTGADVMGTLPMTVAVVGGARGARSVTVERVLLWRDVLYRPAADGVTEWTLVSGEVFLLGDFPSGSIDSRQFGPVPRRSVRHRVKKQPENTEARGASREGR